MVEANPCGKLIDSSVAEPRMSNRVDFGVDSGSGGNF